METQTTIEWKHRHPTEKLARDNAQFLPNCGWKATERANGDWYLQFRCESGKAHRILTYLRRDYPQYKFGEVEQLPAELSE